MISILREFLNVCQILARSRFISVSTRVWMIFGLSELGGFVRNFEDICQEEYGERDVPSEINQYPPRINMSPEKGRFKEENSLPANIFQGIC